jgi:hypothetical protein
MKTRTNQQTADHPEPTPVEVAAIARDEAQRIAALMHKPTLSDPECAEVVGVPISTWYAYKSSLALKQFSIGRRRFTLTKDLLAALEARAS